MELRRDLGKVVRKRRLALGLSQIQLAERMGRGIQQSDISRIERGHLPWPRPDLLQALASALELSTLELLVLSRWMSEEDLKSYRPTSAGHEDRPLAIVAEADKKSGESLMRLLPASRFRLLATTDGETLVAVVRSQHPSLVLLSQRMPGLDLHVLATVIWDRRLATAVLVVGENPEGIPEAFYFLPERASPNDVENILVAAGLM